MKNLILITLTLLPVVAATPPLLAQTYNIPWHRVGPGGTSAGAVYTISGSIGQWGAGKLSGSTFTLNGGFWPGAIAAVGTVPPPSYNLVDLGTQGSGYSEASAINNSGQIVGRFHYSAAFWNDSSSPGVSLGDLPGYSNPTAIGINDSGQIAGYSQILPSGVSAAQFWANSSSSPVKLAPLPGGANSSLAYGINGSGEIVGFTRVTLQEITYGAPVIWVSSTSPPLGLNPPAGNNNTFALAINDSEQIVGSAYDLNAFSYQATYWSNRAALVLALATLGGDSQAWAINASGQIVGWAAGAGRHAVFWADSGSAPLPLGSLGGSYDIAQGINASGQIVGASSGHAVLWLNSTSPPIDLNSVIPASSGWVLQSANAINNQGEIVGNGMIGGEQHGFALLPIHATNPPPTTVTKIAAGIRHSLFLGPGGSLWAMGANEFGVLGDGTTFPHYTPEQILPGGVTAIGAGIFHSLFLKTNGSLWAMGYNGYGQLGDGTTNNRATPVQIMPNSVTAIAAGFYHSLFLKSDGSLWGMGFNNFGQLGDGTTADAHTPEQIVSSGVTAIAVGFVHSLFLKSDGSLWGMGYNGYGELGDTTATTYTPKQLVSSNVTAIAAGELFSLFLKSDGSLWAMGYNLNGQLGDGTTNDSLLPKQILSSGVTAVVAGGFYGTYDSLFLKSDGSLWGMGYNGYGELGDGTTNDSHFPKQIVCSGVTAVAAGFGHTLFVKADGSLWGMGYNYGGQLGDGTQIDSHIPERIVGSGSVPTLLITSVARVGNDLQLSFASDACHTYYVLTTSDLVTGPWAVLPNGISGNGGIVQVTIPNAFSQPRQFYRILQAQ